MLLDIIIEEIFIIFSFDKKSFEDILELFTTNKLFET